MPAAYADVILTEWHDHRFQRPMDANHPTKPHKNPHGRLAFSQIASPASAAPTSDHSVIDVHHGDALRQSNAYRQAS